MNRVQFQPGLSMTQFLDRYGSVEQCEAALIESRWPAGFACPACGGGHSSSFRRQGRLYFQCTACRHQCSVTSGTIFGATKLALTRWFLAMHLLTQSKNNVAALELMRHLGVCYKTVWLIKHKLMEVMRVREQDRQLDGRVEIDDAYLGGERSGGKTGRGSENKVPFVAAVQTTSDGQPQFACLRQQPFTTEAMAVFAASSIAPSATVVSDGLWCFGGMQNVGAEHERIVTGGGKASTRLPQFKAVNTFLGNLKRALGARTTPSTSPSMRIAILRCACGVWRRPLRIGTGHSRSHFWRGMSDWNWPIRSGRTDGSKVTLRCIADVPGSGWHVAALRYQTRGGLKPSVYSSNLCAT